MSVSSIQNARKRAISKEDLASICASIMDAISSLDWTKGKMNDFVIWFSFEKDKAFMRSLQYNKEYERKIRKSK